MRTFGWKVGAAAMIAVGLGYAVAPTSAAQAPW
jgi:hypothetical protein